MAANITIRADGKAEMAYVGQKPWHGIGAELTPGASIATWKTEGGMDWEVLASPETYQFNGETLTSPGNVVLHRSDSGYRLGNVSTGFKIVQPGEVLDFFSDLCESQSLTLETAGTLGGGKRFWALANTGNISDAGNGQIDPIGQYVFLATAADGTLATTAKTTATRVVCQNTMSVALQGKGEFKVSHRSKFDANAAKQALGFKLEDGTKAFDEMIVRLRALNTVKTTEEEARAFFYSLIRPPTTVETRNLKAKTFADLLNEPIFEQANTATKLTGDWRMNREKEEARSPRGFEDMLQAYHSAPGAAPGTARGLVEATTYFVDHVRGTSNDKRMTSAWLGQGDTLKTMAYENASVFAGLLDKPAFVN